MCRREKSRNVAPWKLRLNSKPKSSKRATSTEVVTCIEEALLGVSLFWSEDSFNEAELCVLNLE